MAVEDDARAVAGEPRGGADHAPPSRTVTVDEPARGPVDRGWAPASAPGQLPPVNPARYELIREHARGGLGRILEVRDLRLGRVVAVKEILGDSDAAYARFVREAMITARLEHPAIVPVHDIGRWPSGEPFYSMKLVSGRSLHEVIRGSRTLAARLALLPNLIAVADAIAYAHSEGIIHRDLKPANVLVGAFGETVVIDWGLAKDVRGDAEDELAPAPEGSTDELDTISGRRALTVAGAVMGTAHYMPPEQARGRPVDERADVYALGALLYEVLAGEPPYRGTPDPLAAVLAGAPAPIEAREPSVPPDLAAIARKAMARRPDDRYPSARELAEDLRRFQTGRLVRVHAYSRRALVARWLRRYRAAAIVAAAALSVLAIGGVVSVQRVIAERDVARRRADQLVLTQARGTMERDATQALAWLRTYPADGEDHAGLRTLALEAESRGLARHVPPRDGFFTFTADGHAWIGARDGDHLELHDAATGASVGRLPHRGRVEAIVAAADGHTLAVLDTADTAVTLIDTRTGQARRLAGHRDSVSKVAASPDGRWLATGSSDGTIQLAAIGPGAGRMLRGHEGDVTALAFSRDGRWLFSMASERVAGRLWQVDGEATRTLSGPRDVVAGDVSADGALVAFAHHDGEVSLWSAATGAQVRSLGRHAGAANGVAFSPDGRWVASIGDDGNLLVTDVATGAQRTRSGHAGAIEGLAFSPDSRLIATGGSAGEVRLWEVDGDRERVLGRHVGRVFHLAFAPDGRHLATRITGGAGFDARIWDVEPRGVRALRCHRAAIWKVAVSPDGRRMATGSDDNGVCLWDPRTGEGQRLDGHDGLVIWVAFSPDGARLASASFDGTVRIWDLAACGAAVAGCAPAARVLAGHRGLVWMVAFSPDGRWLASAGADATVRLWDATTGAARILTGHTRVVHAVVFSPDGRRLASTGEDREPWLWDVATGAGSALRGHADRPLVTEFSPDGRALWTTSADQTLRRWDVATGGSRVVAQGLGVEPMFTLSPDGRWLAVSRAEGRVGLIDSATLVERELGRHRAAVSQLAFSPDGARLASAGLDHTVRLWDVPHGALDAVLQNEFQVFSIAFSPDGRWLASAGSGAVARIWPVPAGVAAPRDPRGLAAWMASLSTAELDPRERAQ